jgi:hypothetical protein
MRRLGELLREVRQVLPVPLEELVRVTGRNQVDLHNRLNLSGVFGGGRIHTHVHGRIRKG